MSHQYFMGDQRSRAALLCALYVCGVLWLASSAVCAQDALLTEDFEDVSVWQQRESHGNNAVVVKDVRVEIRSCRDGTRPGAFLRIMDRSSADHWFWIHRKKAQGCWDLSRARTVTVWARNDGATSRLLFLARDDRGNTAYYPLGALESGDWRAVSLDLMRAAPFAGEGTVDWCCIALIGLRTEPGHNYTVDLDDLSIQSGKGQALSETEADSLTRPSALEPPPIGFLASVSSTGLRDSIVSVNLTRNESEKDLDRLLEAGVKWVKLGCFTPVPSRRADYRVAALRKRGLNVLGQLPQALQYSDKLFPDVKGKKGETIPVIYSPKAMEWYKQAVQATAEHFRGSIHVWEIGNEPDGSTFWPPKPDPAAFARLVIETSKVLKAVDPQNQVINGGVCEFWTPNYSVVRDFLTTFFDGGAGAHIDYIGLHPLRSHPESGAPDMSQRRVADEIRGLAARFGRSLPLWDTEWQCTGAVNRAEVPFATDLYEAKGMLRKYLVEADAGFTHMDWQICKATGRMDHPGQIFTKEGHATSKYVTLSHVGALFSGLADPVEVRATLKTPPEDGAVRLLKGGDFDDPSSLQGWKASPDPRVLSLDTQTPFRGHGALKLSGRRPLAADSAQRWRPLLGATVIEARFMLKGDGCQVAVYPAGRNALGEDLPRASVPKRPLTAGPDYAPVCLRFLVEGRWHDVGIRLELPKGGTAFVDDLSLVCYVPPVEIVSFAFKLQGAGSPAVFFWTPVMPSDERRTRAVDIAVKSLPAADYVLLDTFTGECRPIRAERAGDEAIFRGVPLCDYPMAVIPPGVFLTSASPAWLRVFADPDEIVDRALTDRTGDFYLRGFWSMLFNLAERGVLKGDDPKLAAVNRMRTFMRAFPIARKEITVKPPAAAEIVLRPEPAEWLDSVANSGSQDVNRYFYELADADRPAVVRGVTMGGRALPHRPWADSPQNAFSWFTLPRKGEPTEVFVVLPKAAPFDGRGGEISLSLVPRVEALLLSAPAGDARCAAYWTEAGDAANQTYTLELADQPGWSPKVVIIDPRTGAARGEAEVKRLEGGRIEIAVPAAPRPLVLAPLAQSRCLSP